MQTSVLFIVAFILVLGGCLQSNDQELVDKYTQLAISTNNVLECDNLPDKGYSEGGRHAPPPSMSLHDECIYNFALEKNDSSACEKIDESQQEDCYTIIAARTKNPEICDVFDENTGTRYACYSRAGLVNFSICLKLSEWSRYKCFSALAINQSNLSICHELDDEFVGYCYRNFAVETTNSTLCEMIDYSITHDVCLKQIAIKTQDPSLCERINYQREQCFKEAGN